jgi:hypothetical protein
MSDLDPFGREKGEDSLKEMGWTLPSSSPTPVAAPVQTTPASTPFAAPPAPTPTPAAPRRRRRGGGGGLLVLRIVIPLAILAAVGIGVGAAVTGVKHSVTSIPNITIPSLSVPTTPLVQPSKPSKPAAPPTGLSAGSLLRPAGLRAAVARLRGLGRLSTLRVAADRVNAQLVRGSTLRSVQVSSDGSVFRTDVSGAGGALSTFPWSRVNSLAPSRMVRAIGRRPSTVNYLVLSDFAGSPRWYLYLKSGAYYAAGGDGRHPQRIG